MNLANANDLNGVGLPDPRVIEFAQFKNRYGPQKGFQVRFHESQHRWSEIK